MGRHRRGKKPKQIIPRNARRLTVEKIAMRKGCETKNVTMAEMKANIYLGAKRLSRQTHPLIYEKLLAMIQMDFTELQLRLGSHSSHRQQRTKEDILLSWIQVSRVFFLTW